MKIIIPGLDIAGNLIFGSKFSTMQKMFLLTLGVFMTTLTIAQDAGENSKLRHVVFFAFKSDASNSDIEKVEKAFAALPDKISEIQSFEYGTNNSPEGLNDGHTHCFLLTFGSEADRNAYLIHPAHKAFVDVLRPHLEKATVVDYWAKT